MVIFNSYVKLPEGIMVYHMSRKPMKTRPIPLKFPLNSPKTSKIHICLRPLMARTCICGTLGQLPALTMGQLRTGPSP